MNPIDQITKITYRVTATVLRQIADAMDRPIVKDPHEDIGPLGVRVANVDELATAVRTRKLFSRATEAHTQ